MKAKRLILCLALAGLLPVMASCGESESTPVSIKLSTADFSMRVGDSKTLAVVGYESSKVTWTSSNTAIAEVTNGVVSGKGDGECTITASVDGATATCKITVVDLEGYVISEALDNANIQKFNENTSETQTKFRGEQKLMEAGNDNPFVMTPKLTIIDNNSGATLEQGLWLYDYTSNIQEWDETAKTYKVASKTFAEFDAAKGAFQFNENAVGKRLKLSVTPGGLTSSQTGEARFTKTAEVVVKEGYNVYTAAELALFNDTESDHRGGIRHSPSSSDVNAAWKKFRKDHGFDETFLPENLFLQSDIKITKDDIPDVFLYTKSGGYGEVGSLRDGSEIYLRESFDNFILNGNYFDLDTTDMPLATEDLGGDGISHSTLFKVTENRTENEYQEDLTELRKTKSDAEEFEQTTCTFENCSYFGNSPLAQDTKYAGGLIFFKNENFADTSGTDDKSGMHKLVATFSNFNVQRSCIAFYGEGNPDLTIKDCIVEEGFSNSVYLYQGTDMKIQNCIFRKCGGPIIVIDPKLGNDGVYAPKVTVDSNSVMDNDVTGQEPWFTCTGAAQAIPQILGLNACFGPQMTHRGFVTADNKFNCILVKRSATMSLEGSIKFEGTAAQLGFDATIETDPAQAELKVKRDYALSKPMVVMMQTETGVTAWTDGAVAASQADTIISSTFADGVPAGTQEMQTIGAMAASNYFCMSANMGALFGQIMIVSTIRTI